MKYLAIFILTLATSIYAQVDPTSTESVQTIKTDKIDFTFTPAAFYLFGKTEYDFHLTQLVADTSGALVDFTVRSFLEFPLDVFVAGASIGIGSPEDADKSWSAEVGMFTNVSDPGKSMKDSDWYTLENNFAETMVSYTESDAKMDMLLVNAEVTKELFNVGNADIAILAGFRYQKIEQNIIGYDGWQLDTNFVQQPVSGTGPALDYMVTYKGPQFGALTRIDFSSSVQINIKTAVSLTWVKDKDDHLLRKFHTLADGQGIGFISQIGARWFTGSRLMGHNSYVDFVGSYDYYKADISSTRVQYGDGGPSEPPVGYTVGGLPHDIKSQQFKLGLRFGLIF